MEYAYRVYDNIIQATGSELILFFIILAVFFGVISIPFYVATTKRRKAEMQHQMEQQREFIAVIKEISTIMASLKATLDNSGASNVKALDRIHARLDEQNTSIKTAFSDIAQINAKFANTLDNQKEISSKVNKILVLASGGKLPKDGGANSGS